jgi:hypothetical protein
MSANGRQIPQFTGGNVLSPKQHEKMRHAVTALNNIQVKRVPNGTTNIEYSDKNVIIQVGDNPSGVASASVASSGAHPFKLYAVASDQILPADVGKPCYAIRHGTIEYRPRWYHGLNLAVTQQHYNWDYYQNDSPSGGDGGLIATPPDIAGLSDEVGPDIDIGLLDRNGGYFVLDPTEDIVSGVNYGCYYSFYISIDDTTPNQLPIISLVARRFTPGNSGGTYPQAMIPASTDGLEIVPLAVLQVTPGHSAFIDFPTGLGGNASSGPSLNGLIWQIQTTNLINRYDRFMMRYQGIWDTSQYRTWYYGDVVKYDANMAPGGGAGLYVATGAAYNASNPTATPANATGAPFEYIGNIIPP